MPDLAPAGDCPKCQMAAVQCRYNRFQKGDLRIDAWEHKCANCGHRETIAYRSDQPEQAALLALPARCPFCSRDPGEPRR